MSLEFEYYLNGQEAPLITRTVKTGDTNGIFFFNTRDRTFDYYRMVCEPERRAVEVFTMPLVRGFILGTRNVDLYDLRDTIQIP